MGSKHPTGPAEHGDGRSVETPRPPDDLDRNPGIGTSKGAQAPLEAVPGEATTEGDVLNDTTPQGGVLPNQRGRTNR
jgi:hypothetical protein